MNDSTSVLPASLVQFFQVPLATHRADRADLGKTFDAEDHTFSACGLIKFPTTLILKERGV